MFLVRLSLSRQMGCWSVSLLLQNRESRLIETAIGRRMERGPCASCLKLINEHPVVLEHIFICMGIENRCLILLLLEPSDSGSSQFQRTLTANSTS